MVSPPPSAGRPRNVWRVLTHLDPTTYGVDLLRRVVLVSGGAPPSVVQAIGVDVFGGYLGTAAELVILSSFAIAMVALAARLFATRD